MITCVPLMKNTSIRTGTKAAVNRSSIRRRNTMKYCGKAEKAIRSMEMRDCTAKELIVKRSICTDFITVYTVIWQRKTERKRSVSRGMMTSDMRRESEADMDITENSEMRVNWSIYERDTIIRRSEGLSRSTASREISTVSKVRIDISIHRIIRISIPIRVGMNC